MKMDHNVLTSDLDSRIIASIIRSGARAFLLIPLGGFPNLIKDLRQPLSNSELNLKVLEAGFLGFGFIGIR